MKTRILTLLLLLLLPAPLSTEAAQRIRARPVLKADKEYNAILLHVAQHFVLTIPDDKTVADISSAIRCTFLIAPSGALQQLVIENESDTWTGMFEGAAARRTETWLRNAVLDGMHGIPPFDMSRIRASKSARKRTVVFSFGRTGTSTNAASMGFNTGMIDANLNQSLQEQIQAVRDGKEPGAPRLGMTTAEAERRYQRGDKAWAGFTDENIKSTMKPRYEPQQQSLPVIQTPQQFPRQPGDSIPRIDVAISLQ